MGSRSAWNIGLLSRIKCNGAGVRVCISGVRLHGRADGPAAAQDGACKAAAAGEGRGEIQSADGGCGQWHEAARFRGETVERSAGRVEVLLERLRRRHLAMDDGAGN